MEQRSMIELAIQIALDAHAGQVDKANQPYILHPLRMMCKVTEEEEQIVAILHDVVEDSAVTVAELAEYGFSKRVLDAVDCLTRQADEDYEAYIERILTNSLASVIKLVDLDDNINRNHFDDESSKLRRQKYEQAKNRILFG